MKKVQLGSKKNTFLLILISVGFFGIFLLYKLNFSHNQHSENTRKFGKYSGLYEYFVKGRLMKNSASTIKEGTSLPPVKGAFVVVTRNGELQALMSSIRSLEDRFNHEYSYPWIFHEKIQTSDQNGDTIQGTIWFDSKTEGKHYKR